MCSKSSKRKLKEFLQSDRYKNSNFTIKLLNNKYYLLQSNYSKKYVDLKDPYHRWNIKDKYFRDCKGSIYKVIRVFNKLNPNIENINITDISITDIS